MPDEMVMTRGGVGPMGAGALGLEDLLNFRVQRLASKMTLLTTREVLEGTGVHIAEWRVICRLIENGPLKLTELSHMLDLDPGRTSRLLKAAETKELVLRVKDPNDGRASFFHLTDKGRQIFGDAWPRACRSAETFHDLYTDEELGALKQLLDRAIDYATGSLGAK